jgi:Type II secretion system protein C
MQMDRRISSLWQQARAAAALAALIAVLATLVVWEISALAEEEAVSPSSSPADAGAGPVLVEDVQAEFSLPPLGHYSEIVERPLFTTDRKPPAAVPEEEQAVAAGPMVSLPWRLVGVVITPQRRQAILQGGAANTTLHVEPGMQVDQWRVAEVQPDRIVLAMGSQQEQLLLHDYDDVVVATGPVDGDSQQTVQEQTAEDDHGEQAPQTAGDEGSPQELLLRQSQAARSGGPPERARERLQQALQGQPWSPEVAARERALRPRPQAPPVNPGGLSHLPFGKSNAQ